GAQDRRLRREKRHAAGPDDGSGAALVAAGIGSCCMIPGDPAGFRERGPPEALSWASDSGKCPQFKPAPMSVSPDQVRQLRSMQDPWLWIPSSFAFRECPGMMAPDDL